MKSIIAVQYRSSQLYHTPEVLYTTTKSLYFFDNNTAHFFPSAASHSDQQLIALSTTLDKQNPQATCTITSHLVYLIPYEVERGVPLTQTSVHLLLGVYDCKGCDTQILCPQQANEQQGKK